MIQTSATNLPAPISASYDALGQRLSLTDGTGTTSFSYDPLGRVSQVQAPNTGTVGYQYDANGQRTGLTYPDGSTVGYQYFPDGQLETVSQGSTTLASYSYDSAGRLQTLSRNNGATTAYQYDGADRLTDLRTTVGTALRSEFVYQADRLGQTVEVTETLALPSASPSDTATASATSTSTSTSTSTDTASATATATVPTLGEGTPAFIQGNSAVPQTDQSSVAAAYTASQSAGDTNVVVIGWNDDTSTISAVTDSAGNTYHEAAPLTRGSGLSQAIYYASDIAAASAGSNTVTVTFNQAVPYADLRVLEYSDLATDPLDSSASAADIGDAAGSGDLTTGTSNELLVAGGMAGGAFTAAGDGYTSRMITSPDGDIVEDQAVSSSGSYSATAPLGYASPWVLQVVAFRSGASVPATSTSTSTPTPIVPTFVQGNSAVPQTDQSSVAAAYIASQSAGDTNVVVIGWNDDTSTISTVTDSEGNTYHEAAPLSRGTDLSQAIYYASDITAASAGANTVMVTFNQAVPYADLRIAEYSDLATDPLDSTASAADIGDAAGSGDLATSATNDLLVAGGTTTGGFSGPGDGYTSRIITTPDGDILEDQLASSTGTYSATAPVSPGGAWVLQLVALKAATGSPTPTDTATTSGGGMATATDTSTNTATSTPTSAGTSTASSTDTATGTPLPSSFSRTVSYSYDGLQRLTGAVESPGSSFAYSYDLTGNRTGVSVNGTPTASYSYDAADQVVGWGYDAAGNLLSDGTTSYAYDALNRLTGASAMGQDSNYVYNGDGTLVSQTTNGTTTSYAQDLAASQSQILAATTGIISTDYLYGSDIAPLLALTGSARTWYGLDGQGSVRQTLDDGGNVLGMQSYDPYGQIESGSTLTSSFGYTGELQEATTGNEYLRARWYQPGDAQLLGVDPVLASTGQPYAYASDDPVNGSDASGQCTLKVNDKAYSLAGVGGNDPCTRTMLHDFIIAQIGRDVPDSELDPAIETALNSLPPGVGPAAVAEPLDSGQGISPAIQEEAVQAALNGGGNLIFTGALEAVGTAVEFVAGACTAIAAAIVASPAIAITIAVVVVAGTLILVTSRSGSLQSGAGTITPVPQPAPTPGQFTQPKLQPTGVPASGYKGRLSRSGRLPRTDQNKRQGPEILYHYTNKDAALRIQATGMLYVTQAIRDPRTGILYPEGAYATDIAPIARGYTQRTLAQTIFFNRSRADVSWFVALKNDESQNPPWVRVADHQFAILSDELMVHVQPIDAGRNPMPIQ